MTTWNQVQNGNAHVSDGVMGFWASFLPGTTAQEVLDNYMSTADYSAATCDFTVTATIEGDVARTIVHVLGEGGIE
jgi:hypothetical protein